MYRSHEFDTGSDVLATGSDSLSHVVRSIDIDSIRENRKQPRTYFDEQALHELAASIREHGVIQPLIVTAHEAGGYELIAGERRWRAARRAGLAQVPALVKDATPQQLLELALVENVQRADLNPLEEGRAYQTLKDEFGLKDDDIAQRVGKSRVAVVNARRLTRLIPAAQQALLDGTMSAGHGRALLRLEQPEQQAAALALIQRLDLSVREVERLAELVQHELLIPATRQALLEGYISVGHAQVLLTLADHGAQAAAVDAIVAQELDVRAAERLCALLAGGVFPDRVLAQTGGRAQDHHVPASVLSPLPEQHVHPAGKAATAPSFVPEDAATRRMFEEALGTPVQLARSGSTIKVTITLYNDEQLEALYDLVSRSL